MTGLRRKDGKDGKDGKDRKDPPGSRIPYGDTLVFLDPHSREGTTA